MPNTVYALATIFDKEIIFYTFRSEHCLSLYPRSFSWCDIITDDCADFANKIPPYIKTNEVYIPNLRKFLKCTFTNKSFNKLPL